MKLIKFISCNSSIDFNRALSDFNEEIKDGLKEIVDIKFQIGMRNTHLNYSAIVIYKKMVVVVNKEDVDFQ